MLLHQIEFNQRQRTPLHDSTVARYNGCGTVDEGKVGGAKLAGVKGAPPRGYAAACVYVFASLLVLSCAAGVKLKRRRRLQGLNIASHPKLRAESSKEFFAGNPRSY
jgi:hypothetical protein